MSLLNSITLEELPTLPERILRIEIIVPLLRKIFTRVDDLHGSQEYGIDVYFEAHDFFDRPKYFGVSLKKGDLDNASAPSKNSIPTILTQMDKAFVKARFSSNDEAVHLHGYYIIASGKFGQDARDYLLLQRPNYPYVDFLDGEELFRIISDRHLLRHKRISWKTFPYRSFLKEGGIIR